MPGLVEGSSYQLLMVIVIGVVGAGAGTGVVVVVVLIRSAAEEFFIDKIF